MKVKKKLKILAIIGIRANSKGLKNKNILKLNNKPLVGWILNAAKNSKKINRVIVSTDSKRYQKIVIKLGAESPFLRPKKYATSSSKEIAFIKYTLKKLEKIENYKPDLVVRLLATSPFQKSKDIDKAIKILIKDKTASSSVIISEARQHPLKALKIIGKQNKKKLVGYFDNKGESVTGLPRQMFKKAYFRSNVIVFRPKILNKNTTTGKIVKYLIVKKHYNIDIDNKIDFLFAKFLVKNNLHI